ncbi:hypothetical protein GCM10009775_18850 [Microbacterium aoyamense]|uniref:Uncharacterized protein n=1 Tax=Microbacterium aoyamense TaxID=344166 RepID=A0ABN2PPF1_9MICO|nr:hypothetical protein [Microbacterium aoyamense]
MRIRRAALVAATVVALLTGCAAAPAVDQEAAQSWLRDSEKSIDGRTDLLGTTSGMTSRSSDDGITLSFDDPVTVSAFEVACFGGGSAEFGYSLSGDGVGIGVQSEVECTEVPAMIDVGVDGATEVADVSSVVTRMTSPDSDTTFTVAVVGTTP